MVDINLLPDDLRKREDKEKKAAEKKPQVFEMKLSVPDDGKTAATEKGKIMTAGESIPKLDRPVPLSKLREAVFEELTKSEGRERAQKIKETGDEFSFSALRKPSTGAIHVLEAVPKKEPSAMVQPARPHPHAPVPPPVKKTPAPPPVKEVAVHLPQAKKRRGFWAWLKSLFRRRREAKPPKIILEKPLTPRPVAPPPPPLKALSREPLKVVVSQIKPPVRAAPAVSAAPKPTIVPMPAPASPPVPVASVKLPPTAVMQKSHGRDSRQVEDPVRTLEINLIPDSEGFRPETNVARRFLVLAVAIFASCLLVGIAYGFVRFYEQEVGREITAAQSNLDFLKQKIGEYSQDRESADALIKKLAFIEQLIDGHVYWTRVFEKLEANTVSDVYFLEFAASRTGDITLFGVGKDYTSVARQLVAFREAKDFISHVSINSATAFPILTKDGYEIERTEFEAVIKLAPEVFYKQLSDL